MNSTATHLVQGQVPPSSVKYLKVSMSLFATLKGTHCHQAKDNFCQVEVLPSTVVPAWEFGFISGCLCHSYSGCGGLGLMGS